MRRHFNGYRIQINLKDYLTVLRTKIRGNVEPIFRKIPKKYRGIDKQLR